MAHHDISEAFRDDNQLKQFVLSDVIPTGRVLGNGSYGSVEEVFYKHIICAGKKLHEVLVDMENEGVSEVVSKYLQECQLMSSLRHPNITQFLGLCFLPGTQLPLLVMERLDTSLSDLLDHMPNLPLSLKCSMLQDVACGLLYLHDRPSPVIHRDLTARNVLLTESLVAKITDMGNSRIVSIEPGKLAQTLTKHPGTLVYMPPESQDDIHRYGASMDIFSFGHLGLYTITQKFPGDLLPSTFIDPNNTESVRARSEVDRRSMYIKQLEGQVGSDHPDLVSIVKQCLDNDPSERPSTENLLTSMKAIKEEVEGEYGGGVVKLDLAQVSLAKEVAEKEQTLKELAYQNMKQEEEYNNLRRATEEFAKQMDVRVKSIEMLQADDKAKAEKIHKLQTDSAAKDEEIEQLKKQLSEFQNLRARLRGEFESSGVIQSIKEEVATSSPSTEAKEEVAEPEHTKTWEIDRQQINLVRKVAEGQFGEVWAGTWKDTSLVSIKVIKPGTNTSVESLNEVVLMKKLVHSNLVKLCGLCTQEEPFYIVTESSKYGFLLGYLRSSENRADCELAQRINMSQQIASGMAYLELNNCVHRDLAARNVLVDNVRTCKVANFSSARALNEELVFHDQSGSKIPVKWTAPEAALTRCFTVKSDVWSFGVLLYEIITFGMMPYPEMKNAQVVNRVSNGYRMPLPENCPGKFHEIMLDCWKEEPETRPTFEALKWILDEYFMSQNQYRNVQDKKN